MIRTVVLHDGRFEEPGLGRLVFSNEITIKSHTTPGEERHKEPRECSGLASQWIRSGSGPQDTPYSYRHLPCILGEHLPDLDSKGSLLLLFSQFHFFLRWLLLLAWFLVPGANFDIFKLLRAAAYCL